LVKHLPDTCVRSDFASKAPEARVPAWINGRAETGLHVAAMSLAGLRRRSHTAGSGGAQGP